ncbi:MAG: hypothetical protein ISS70_14420 [Phycisphaerae bacterium]|nr:hypothetical protein [Phycisphaerae bacterium]
MFLHPVCLMGQEVPGQYRETFSESFPIRKQQHLELKEYVDKLIAEQKVRSLSFFKPDFSSIERYKESLLPYRDKHARRLGYPPPKPVEGAEPRFVYVGKDSFEFSVHPGGHVFEIESNFRFLDRHLKK